MFEQKDIRAYQQASATILTICTRKDYRFVCVQINKNRMKMPRRGLMTPIEFIEATKYLFQLGAKKYPFSARVLPVVAFTGLGLVCMEFSNPTNNNNTTTPFVDIKNNQNSVVYNNNNNKDSNKFDRSVLDDVFNKNQNLKKDDLFDPYNKQEMEELEHKKRMNMKPETRRVYDMLKGLKNKTREEKLKDAFDAYDNFMMPNNQQEQQESKKL